MSQKKAREARRAAQALADIRNPRRSRNLIVSAVVVSVFLAAVVVISAISRSGQDKPGTGGGGQAVVVRDNSHRLGSPGDGKVTLVEFLDFECEACRAMFPVVEELRTTYRGRVTFVARYFPIPSHFNAERAARAVEAAAQQGQFEQMYTKMYETQSQWGEQRVAMDEVFRGLARELGLEMTRWEQDYNAPATLQRIKDDAADGQALGVQGTPTFFLNGTQLQVRSGADLTKAIDAALAG